MLNAGGEYREIKEERWRRGGGSGGVQTRARVFGELLGR